MLQPCIFFYVPQPLWPDTLPKNASENWPGFGLGIYAWTIQTYLRLRDSGLSCALVDQLPEEGIVFLHRNAFRSHPRGIEVRPKRLLICFQGDLLPHPDAQAHILQNPVQENRQSWAYFVPHWPQPGLQSRDANRGDRFETISFFGHADNLAPEFSGSAWVASLNRLGLQWQPMINNNQWHDQSTLDAPWDSYRNVDAIIAVRSFDQRTLAQTKKYRHKPATKLYNAWLAGVPAILGPESGYRAERKNDLDYLEVTSYSEVLQALVRLKEDVELRRAMVRNGWLRSQAITPERLTERWLGFVQSTLLPAYDDWCHRNSWQQKMVMYGNHLRYGSQRLRQRWRDWQYSPG